MIPTKKRPGIGWLRGRTASESNGAFTKAKTRDLILCDIPEDYPPPICIYTWYPIWPFVLGHTPLTGKKKNSAIRICTFFSQRHVENIGVSYGQVTQMTRKNKKNSHTGKYGQTREFDRETKQVIRGARYL